MKPHSFKKPMLNTSALACLVLLLSFVATPTSASDLAGVIYQPVASSGGTALRLNGAGVRRAAGSDLYAAGLYLDQPVLSLDAVLQSRAPKQLRLVMLSEASANDFAGWLAQGLAANSSDAELVSLTPALFGLGELFGDQQKLLAGDAFQIDWAEASGTTLSLIEKGAAAAHKVRSFEQPGLFSAMLRIWLGDQPADAGLKRALLGQKT
jgi:hypothetical protein